MAITVNVKGLIWWIALITAGRGGVKRSTADMSDHVGEEADVDPAEREADECSG